MANDLEINSTHLVVLKKNNHDKTVLIDYLLLSNPKRKLLDRAYKKCRDEHFHKEYPNEILDADEELRSIFLKDYDFCSEMSGTYQGLSDISTNFYDYDSDLSEQKIKEKVIEYKASLNHNLHLRDLAYMLELAYDKAENDSNVLAMSHRRHGWTWTENPFELTKKLRVQFKTNFGFGSKSYFFAKLSFKDIDIIPFSEWVKYRDSRYDQILKYSQRYEVTNESWKNAMEYVKDAINLCVKDEVEFIETYVITECKWLLEGLIGICNVENPSDKFLKEMAEKRDRVDYKGKKLSGSLNFIKSMAEFESLPIVSNFIKELEKLCEDELPTLVKEYKENSNDLSKAENNLEIEQPIFHKLQVDLNEITGTFIPLQKKYERISALNERIKKYQAKNFDGGKRLQKLFKIKYHDYEEIKVDYLKMKPKYEDILAKYSKSNAKNIKIQRLIKKFKDYKSQFEFYIGKIDNYLLDYIQNYKSIGIYKIDS